jgi:thioredoxin 1
MSGEHEQFISDENQELKSIRHRKLNDSSKSRETKREMIDKPVHVTDANFDEIIQKNRLALIDFWADWCGPCRALAPTIEEVAREHAGKVLVGKLNVDENMQTAQRFQVFSIPTVVIMKNGKEVDRVVGCVPKEYIVTALKKHSGL